MNATLYEEMPKVLTKLSKSEIKRFKLLAEKEIEEWQDFLNHLEAL